MRLRLKLSLKAIYARLFRSVGPTPEPPQQWIINGSRVDQAPEGPTVTWQVNGSTVSNTEV